MIEGRYSEGKSERFPTLASELVRLKVDVIVASGSQATRAAKEATATIPVVFVSVADPVGAGFVASLARPGGHTTGMANQLGDLEKNLQFAREVVPRLRNIGIMWNPIDPGSAAGFRTFQQRYAGLGLRVISAPVRSIEDFEGTFEALSRDHADFLMVHGSPVISLNRQRVGEFALRNRLPTMTEVRTMVENGSIMMSYGPDFADLFRHGATYVDKILKGAKPADLPVEQPTKFELVINLKIAKALGLTIPPSLLAQADEVIQ